MAFKPFCRKCRGWHRPTFIGCPDPEPEDPSGRAEPPKTKTTLDAMVYFADPIPDKNVFVYGEVAAKCRCICGRTCYYPTKHVSGLRVFARCYCGQTFPVTKEYKMSKQAVALKVALRLENLTKELLAESKDLSGEDLLVQVDICKRLVQQAAQLRDWKDDRRERPF